MTRKFLMRHIQKEGKHFLEISDDLADVHKSYAEMLLQRYRENIRDFFVTGNDPKEMRQWVIGQRLFQSMLNQYRIPYIHDEPAFKFAEERLVPDFIIPKFGEIEIKTLSMNTDTLIIKKKTWDVYVKNDTIPDYVIALMMLNREETMAEIVGYEHGKEVSGLPNAPHICIYSPCYSKLYKDLHPFSEIFGELKACSIKPPKKEQSQSPLAKFTAI